MCVIRVRSVFYLVVFVVGPSAHATYRQSFNNAYKNIKQEAAKISTAIRALNLSSVGILESLKQYEETLDASNRDVSKDSNTCSAAIGRMFLRLFEGKIEAVQMIDANSIYQSGLVWGNIWNFGAFDECLIIDVDEDNVTFVGKHCFIDLQIRFITLPVLDPGEVAVIGSKLNYWFSVCMPSTCNPESLAHVLNGLAHDADDILSYFNYSIEFSIDEANCHTQVNPPLTSSEVFGITVTVLLLGVTGLCTLIDVAVISPKYGASSLRRQPGVCKYVLAFSACSNGKQLLDTRTRDDDIQAVHGLKFIGIVWVMAGYQIKLSVLNPLSNLLGALDFVYRWTTMIILNVPCAVDMFFIISGILNTYSFLSCSRRRTLVGNFVNYIHRYIRLSPAYAVMMIVTATWFYRLSKGPMWEIIIGEARNECQHNWWSGLLFINNYVNPTENCMFQSWYLAVDMQLYWLSPIVMYCLWRWPKLGLFILALLLSFSGVIVFYITYEREFKEPVILSYDPDVVNRQIELLYMPTHTNIVSYVLGVLCGGCMYQIKRRKVKMEIHPALNLVLWCLAVCGMVWALVGDFPLYQFDNPYNRMSSSLITTFYRLVWSLAIFWVIVACNTGHAGSVRFLSMKFWIPLSRLTYCMFLTFAAVILYTIGSLKQPQYFSYYTQIMLLLGEIVLTIILATVLYLTVEAPIKSLEKILRGESRYEDQKSVREDQNKVLSQLEIFR